MKNILEAPFMVEMIRTTTNMYQQGWDERNGGNISLMLDRNEAEEYLDTGKVLRTIPTGFTAPELDGKYFLVTGTGKYFKNVQYAPEVNLGIVRLKEQGQQAELLWGYADGGQFTSEFPAHWQMCTECVVVFPDGVNMLPWMLCGTNEIGEATAEKMKTARLVVWSQHGIYGAGKDLDETFGLIETAEKAAEIYMKIAHLPRINTITDEQMHLLEKRFNIKAREGYLD